MLRYLPIIFIYTLALLSCSCSEYDTPPIHKHVCDLYLGYTDGYVDVANNGLFQGTNVCSKYEGNECRQGYHVVLSEEQKFYNACMKNCSRDDHTCALNQVKGLLSATTLPETSLYWDKRFKKNMITQNDLNAIQNLNCSLPDYDECLSANDVPFRAKGICKYGHIIYHIFKFVQSQCAIPQENLQHKLKFYYTHLAIHKYEQSTGYKIAP